MKATLAAATAAAALPLLAACGSPHASRASGGGTPAAASHTDPALTARQQRFIDGINAAFARMNEEPTETEAQIAAMGRRACAARRSGSPQSALTGGTNAGLVVRSAERYLCPAYLPRVLLRLSGSGIANSRPVLVRTGTVTVRYSWDCSSYGFAGNFIADLETGEQSSASSDDQSIANDLGMGGTRKTTVYPENRGDLYHVAVNSECNWSLLVRTG